MIYTVRADLALDYNRYFHTTHSGNGPLGFGWKLSVPFVTSKADKGCLNTRMMTNPKSLFCLIKDIYTEYIQLQ